MEDTLKNKQHSRRKRKSEKTAVKGAVKEDSTDRSISSGPNQKCASSHRRSPVLPECDSPGTEVQNCSQFLEYEPTVIWESPQASPNSSHEQNSKVIDLITPPQQKCFFKKKPVITKPTRKLPGAADPSFLTKLLDLSEKYKDNEDLCSEEKEQEGSPCHTDLAAAEILNQDTVNRQEPDSCTLLEKDDFGMLLADDDDDDVFVQCTQEAECKHFEQPNGSVSPHNTFRKTKIVQSDEIKSSSKHENMVKLPTKLPSGKKNISSEQSPVTKPRRARTPGSAKYYKDGQFLGYGSRKSPRTKKNIFESVTYQEICDDSFESALQTLVDEDYSFLDTSVGIDMDKTGIDKKCSPTEQTANTKMKTSHNEVRNLPNVSCLASKSLKPAKNDRTNTKSRVGTPNRKSLGSHSTLLSDSGDALFETATLEDDMVNETELVNVLEIVESQAVTSSPPLRCTPEEIQRKRIEAKQKLAKKKLDSKTKTSLPSVIRPKR